MPVERDPTGKDAHESGAKLDAGKHRAGLVLNGFARALTAVSHVGTYGAIKYSDNGWMNVPNGIARYTDAMLRHFLAEATGEIVDPETGLLHAAQGAWNALARLDLIIRHLESTIDSPQETSHDGNRTSPDVQDDRRHVVHRRRRSAHPPSRTARAGSHRRVRRASNPKRKGA